MATDNDARRFASRATRKQPQHTEREQQQQNLWQQQQHEEQLRALNEVVSVATRRVFQSPSTLSDLRAVQQHLPELCAFVDALLPYTGTDSDDAVHAQQKRDAATRSVFRDPRAQWLSRSAMESGVTLLLCGQLLQCVGARCVARANASPARLVLLLLCDQLLTPCSARLGATSRNCEWRGRKPAYHTMPCASVWDALLPFLDRMAKRYPQTLQDVLQLYADASQSSSSDSATVVPAVRVSCSFVRVAGLWRLMESLGGADYALSAPAATAPADSELHDTAAIESLLDAVLQFIARTSVLEVIIAAESTTTVACNSSSSSSSLDTADTLFADLLMDLFFTKLQEFLFNCPRSRRIARRALERAIVRVGVAQAAHRQSLPTRNDDNCRQSTVAAAAVAVFTAVSCAFVQGLARRVVSGLLVAYQDAIATASDNNNNCKNNNNCNSNNNSNNNDSYNCNSNNNSNNNGNDSNNNNNYMRTHLLHVLIGLCAHVDLVPLASVFDVLDVLLDAYATVSGRHALLCVVYIAVHRAAAVRKLGRGSSSVDSESSRPKSSLTSYLQLLHFQDRLTRDVALDDFYAMPIDWMALVWQEWLAFSDADVASFVDGATAAAAVEGDSNANSALDALARSLPFRDVDTVFPRQRQRLSAHIVTLQVALTFVQQTSSHYSSHDVADGSSRAAKRQRVAEVDPDVAARRDSVLLLPDVMERVCAFLTAKRLCRLALVSHAFAAMSRSQRLWQSLFVAMTARDDTPVTCRHSATYNHDWRVMYQQRYDARRRLRKKLAKAATARLERLDTDNGDDGRSSAADAAGAQFTARLCHVCGCSCVIASVQQLAAHMKTHEQFICSSSSVGSTDGSELLGCGAAFATLAQLKRHRAVAHGETVAAVRSAKPRIACSVAGCARTYTSSKRLATHCTLKHPEERASGAGDSSSA